MDTLYFRTGGGHENWTNLDDIVVSTSFADVTAIPEPSAYAAVAGVLGLIIVLLRRRARS